MYKIVEEGLISIVTGWFMIILFSEAFVAVGISFWVWRKLTAAKLKSPSSMLAPIATPISIVIGVIFLAAAGLLSHQYNAYAEKLQHDEQEKKKVDERSSPDYLEKKLRKWLDRGGFKSQVYPSQEGESIRVTAEREEEAFTVTQLKHAPGILFVGTDLEANEVTQTQLDNLPQEAKAELYWRINAELLRLGVQYKSDKLGHHRLKQEFAIDPESGGTDFLYQLLMLHRAGQLIGMQIDAVLWKNQKQAKRP